MHTHKNIYVEKLTCFLLGLVILLGGRSSQCYYLKQTKKAKRLAKMLYRSKVIMALPEPIEFNYADLKDDKGTHAFESITEQLIGMASSVADRISGAFYKTLDPLVDAKRLNLFFYKNIASKMQNSAVFIYAVSKKEKGLCILPSSPWGKELKSYGKSVGLQVTIVPSFQQYGMIDLFKKVNIRSKKDTIHKAQSDAPVPQGSIGVWYTGRTLDKDVSKRSEIFWLLDKGPIDPADVLLYFERKDIAPPPDGVQVMHEMGVRIASFYPIDTLTPTSVWTRSDEYSKQMQIQIKRVLWAYIQSWLTFKPVPFFFIERMAWFVRTYAIWYDFFGTTGIKVNIYSDFINPGQVAVNQAMRHRGGINAVYQWSHIHFNSALLSMDTDVLFSFGPAYAPYNQFNKSIIGEFLPVGYPWNVQSPQLRQSAASLRSKIMAKGATFVICYLDENSSEDRFSLISNKKAQTIYSFWLTQVINDSTLGIIFKPAYIHDFDKRIFSALKNIFDQALATGRCVIIGDGHYKTDTLPAEVALASDVTVGLLIAGTAVLESVISGAKAVFLDLEGLYHKPIYQWGKDNVVFDSCEQLATVIARYRSNPSQLPAFGDLKEWAYEHEPFHDGHGPNRIAQYIQKLVDERKQVA